MDILNKLITVVQFGISHYQEIVLAAFHIVGDVMALCASLAAFFMMIPGDSPERELKQFANWLSKYSQK